MLIFIFLLIIIIIIICHNYIKSGSAEPKYYSLEIYGKNYPFYSSIDYPASYEGKRYMLYSLRKDYKHLEHYNIVEKYINSYDIFSPDIALFVYDYFNCKSVLDTHLNMGFRYMAAIEKNISYIGYDNYFNLYDTRKCLNKSILQINKDDIKNKIDLIFCCPPFKINRDHIMALIDKTSACMPKYFILCFRSSNKILNCLSIYYNYTGCIPYSINRFLYPMWIFKNSKTIEKATKKDEDYILTTEKNKYTIDTVNRYAVISLLMINDIYLIGLIVLAKSILRFGKPHNVDLICMYTPDISREALRILADYYIIKPVDYITLPEKKIRLPDPAIKKIYSKTFTKIQCMKFTEYKKIVLIDADMAVISNKFFNIFNYTAPAAVYHGYTTPFIRDELIAKYKPPENDEIYPEYLFKESFGRDIWNPHYPDKKVPMHFLRSIETSICLLQPSINDFYNMMKLLKTSKPYTFMSDTTLLNIYYKKWHYLNYNYLGRWANTEEDRKIIVLDLFGPKPWDLECKKYVEVYSENNIWYKMFRDFYEMEFKKYNYEQFITIYKHIKKKDILDSPIIVYNNYYVYYDEDKKKYLGCGRIRLMENLYIDKLTGDFIPVLKYLIFWNSSPSGIYIKSPCELNSDSNLNLNLNLKFIKNKKNYFIYLYKNGSD